MFFFSATILLLSPLIRGGNREISLIVLLALSLLLLAVLCAQYAYLSCSNENADNKASDSVWRRVFFCILLLSPVWIGLLHLFPLPLNLWRTIPGRDFYLEILQAINLPLPNSFSMSLYPSNTWASLLAGVPIVAVFLAAQFLSLKAIKSLLAIILFSAILQVFLSVLQIAFGGSSIFYFDLNTGGTTIGSFANRNHLANFLSMSLPICIYILFDQSTKSERNNPTLFTTTNKPIVLAILLFFGFAILGILLTTLSRGGLISGFIGLGISICIYLVAVDVKLSRKQRLAFLCLALFFMASAVLFSGLDGIKLRLGEQFLTDAEVRNSMTSATLTAAWQFWPWGSGLGSFEAVFPKFQPQINLGYVDYAHNDYAQMLMELGAVGLILMAMFAILLIHQMVSLINLYRIERRLSKNAVLQCFCGVSLLVFLLHSWVEFNMHIPALVITAAFLSGIFLRKLGKQSK